MEIGSPLGLKTPPPESEHGFHALVVFKFGSGYLAGGIVHGQEQTLFQTDNCFVSAFKPIVITAVELLPMSP